MASQVPFILNISKALLTTIVVSWFVSPVLAGSLVKEIINQIDPKTITHQSDSISNQSDSVHHKLDVPRGTVAEPPELQHALPGEPGTVLSGPIKPK